jgi:hypothetical protein
VIVGENARLQAALSAQIALPAQTLPSTRLSGTATASAKSSSAASALPFGHSQAYPRPPSTPEGLTRPKTLMTCQGSEDSGVSTADEFLWPTADILSKHAVASVIPHAELLVPTLHFPLEGSAFSDEQEAEEFANLLTMSLA